MTPWTVAHQAPLSMEFSRQEYWSRVPFPPSGDLPDPEIKPVSLRSPALSGRFFTTSAMWEAPGSSLESQITCGYHIFLVSFNQEQSLRIYFS